MGWWRIYAKGWRSAWEFSFVFDLQKGLESWSCKAVSLPSPKESQKMKDIEMTMMPKMPKWVKAQAICDTLALWQWPPVTSSSEMIEANESEIYMNFTQQWNHTSFHVFNIFCSTAKADETTGAQPEKCRSHPTHSCATKSTGSLFIFVKVTEFGHLFFSPSLPLPASLFRAALFSATSSCDVSTTGCQWKFKWRSVSVDLIYHDNRCGHRMGRGP